MAYSDLEARFWSHVEVTCTCWLWRGAKLKDGYGAFQLRQGKLVQAHRFAFELTNGKTNLCVLHRCDNPSCVNPDHLFAGTKMDNTRDMVAKGRQYRALSPAQRTEMISRYAAGGVTQKQLANEYNIATGTVSHVVNGKSWAKAD